MSEGVSISRSANETQDDPAARNDRLIAVLQSCFSDLIMKQEDQAERIQKAVEALKPPAPVADKKMAFWNSYMRVADEHDKEFQQKYSTDLDTGLIFAGLFSAVGSAFIIQIQPELAVSHPPRPIIVVVQTLLYVSLFTTLLASLLGVLGKQWVMYYQAAGSRGTIEERGLERQRKLDGLVKWKFDIILQMFPLLLQLALLLFSGALSVYLWSIYIPIAIVVLGLTSLGWSLYFFLLGSAMVSLDSPFQTPLARVMRRLYVLSCSALSQLGTLLSMIFLGLCGLCAVLFPRISFLPRWTTREPPLSDTAPKSRYNPYAEVYFAPPSAEVSAVLWALETSTDPFIITAAAEMAVDIQWPLELDPTSPMVRLAETFESCFNFSYNGYQWTRTLREGAIHRAILCGRAYCALKLVGRASGINLKRDLGFRIFRSGDPIPFDNEDPVGFAHLSNVLRIIEGWPELPLEQETSATRWALHVIPAHAAHDSKPNFDSIQSRVEHFMIQFQADQLPILDQSTLTSYICCLNSFFGPITPRILVLIDKSLLKIIMLTDLFKALQVSTIDPPLIVRIVNTTAHLTRQSIAPITTQSQTHRFGRIGHIGMTDMAILMTEMYKFCASLPRTADAHDVFVSAAILTRVETVEDLKSVGIDDYGPQPPDWLYASLQRLHISSEGQEWDDDTHFKIESLMQALVCNARIRKPPVEVFRLIMRALCPPRDLAFLSFILLQKMPQCFLDPDFRDILLEYSAWEHLGLVALKYNHVLSVPQEFLAMGAHIAPTPEWRPSIYRELPTWIAVYCDSSTLSDWGRHPPWTTDHFCNVLRQVWVPDFVDDHEYADKTEKGWALALAALANAWKAYDFSTSAALNGFAGLARCTIWTMFRLEYLCTKREITFGSDSYARAEISSNVGTTSFIKVATAVGQAAHHARSSIPHSLLPLPEVLRMRSGPSVHPLELMARFLEFLGRKLAMEPNSSEVQLVSWRNGYKDWPQLKEHLYAEVHKIMTETSDE